MGVRGKAVPQHEIEAIRRWWRRWQASGMSSRGCISNAAKQFQRSRHTIYLVVFGDPKNKRR